MIPTSPMVLTQAGDPVVGVNWFDFSDPGNVVLIVGIIIPLITGALTKFHASGAIKAVVTLVLTAITATIGTLIGEDGGFAFDTFFNALVSTFVPAIAVYYGLLKPTGIAGAVQDKTATFGLGSNAAVTPGLGYVPRHAANDPAVVDAPMPEEGEGQAPQA